MISGFFYYSGLILQKHKLPDLTIKHVISPVILAAF